MIGIIFASVFVGLVIGVLASLFCNDGTELAITGTTLYLLASVCICYVVSAI